MSSELFHQKPDSGEWTKIAEIENISLEHLPSEKDIDEYVVGIRKTEFTTDIIWDSPVDIVRLNENCRYGFSRRMFGIDWYEEILTFTANVSFKSETGSMSLKPTSQPVTVRGEWWRRFGYKVFSLLPYRKKVIADLEDD